MDEHDPQVRPVRRRVPVPDDAPVQDQMLGFFGRDRVKAPEALAAGGSLGHVRPPAVPVRALAHGLPARRRSPHRAVQLAVRPPDRRRVAAAHRGHRHRAQPARADRRHPRSIGGSGSGGTATPVHQSDTGDRHLEVADAAGGRRRTPTGRRGSRRAQAGRAARAAGRRPRRRARSRGRDGRCGSACPTAAPRRSPTSCAARSSVEHADIEDFVLRAGQRHADVPARQRRRRRRHGHHPRAARRGARQRHAQVPADPGGARARRPADRSPTCRSSSTSSARSCRSASTPWPCRTSGPGASCPRPWSTTSPCSAGARPTASRSGRSTRSSSCSGSRTSTRRRRSSTRRSSSHQRRVAARAADVEDFLARVEPFLEPTASGRGRCCRAPRRRGADAGAHPGRGRGLRRLRLARRAGRSTRRRGRRRWKDDRAAADARCDHRRRGRRVRWTPRR